MYRLRTVAVTSPLLHSPARRHAPCLGRGVQLLWRRKQSAQVAAAVRREDEENIPPRLGTPPLSPPSMPPPMPLPARALPGPFAVEQVDGRARHLSWSEHGGIAKEWKELAAGDSEDEAAVSTRPSRGGRVMSWLRQMFLPTNYPHSVHKSYVASVPSCHPWNVCL